MCLSWLNISRETGIKMKLHTRSHGILATVRGGGHIEHIAPLFKSESPTQVIFCFCSFPTLLIWKTLVQSLWGKYKYTEQNKNDDMSICTGGYDTYLVPFWGFEGCGSKHLGQNLPILW